MKIVAVAETGSNRPLCATTIRVAAEAVTRAAQYAAYTRRRRGIPVDQCGARSDFLVDGAPTCRAHAGQAALNHLLNQN